MTTAIGFFDGVHLGHQEILKGVDRVITFRNHPLDVLTPRSPPHLIMTLDERLAAIHACGVRDIEVLDFTRGVAMWTAKLFLSDYVAIGKIRCGADARFGRDGEGTVDFARSLGYVVEAVPPVLYEGEPISSSRIRLELEAGHIEVANAMLGHPCAILGHVFRGKGEGAKIGFPTINMHPRNLTLLLPRGVYEISVGEKRGIANFGVAPTMGKTAWTKNVWEIHFLTTPPSVRDGDELTISLKRFIREERKFRSKAELVRQIKKDISSLDSPIQKG